MGFADPIAAALLRDPRDLPLFRFALRASALVVAGAGVYGAVATGSAAAWWGAVALFVAIYLINLEPFITMFHDINHRPLFQRRFAWLGGWLYGVLGPAYGSPPATYYTHHVLMHHPANNLHHDASTTLPYRRDSAADFLRYYARFFFCLRAVRHFLRSAYPGKDALPRRVMLGEFGYWAVVFAAASVDAASTAVVFGLPLLVTRSLLIIGNWGEHCFVDPAAPDNIYRNSTDLLGDRNRRSFNVGYHIGHHLRPGAHYSTQPAYFEANKERYGANDAVVFEGLSYPGLWWRLMIGDYETLASRFVQLPGAPVRGRDEVIAMLRSRVVEVPDAR